MQKEIDALFGDFTDAYTVLKGQTTVLDPDDTALVINGAGNLQLFLPEDGEVSDRGLALVEIFNAMCRDAAGTRNKQGQPLPENAEYQGFTEPFVAKMKGRGG